MTDKDPDPYYTSLCSSNTLQSNKRGFFLDYADHVTEKAGTKWLNKVFGKLSANKDRIGACYSNSQVNASVNQTLQHVQEMYRVKSAQVSRQRRLEGDRTLSAGDPQSAVLLYSQAVIRAPTQGVDKTVDGGSSLPLALAARSEALLIAEEHDLSLVDIQLAIKEGFPEHLRYELYWRMGRCYQGMYHIPKARVSLQLASRLLSQNSDLIGPKNVMSMMRLQEEISNLDSFETGTSETEAELKDTTEEPEVTGGPNPHLPSASHLVAVSYTKEAGRFAVASKHIKTGDILIVEKPYAACLLPEMFGSHCHHCFKRVKAPVACPDCSGLAFCSVPCRSEACSTYHKYECHFMDLLIGSGMSILCHVALRMITQSSLKYFLGIRESLTSTKPDNLPSGDKYLSVYNLVAHADRRPAEDFLHRTLMAVFLLKCLQKGGYFAAPSTNETALTDEEQYIGSLLLHHLQLLQFNAHEVYETKVEAAHKLRGSRTVYIGVAIYPTVALFNHDCYPAVTRYFVGRSIVIIAARPLEPGEMVGENYGPVFTKRPLAIRQRALTSRYWFHCACRACKEDWPTFDTLSNHSFRLRCPTPKCTQLLSMPGQKKVAQKHDATKGGVKCPSCRKHVSLEDVLATMYDCEPDYTEGLDAMETGDPSKAVPLFCSYLNRMHSVGFPPHRDIPLCQEALRACLADRGNVWIAPPASTTAAPSDAK